VHQHNRKHMEGVSELSETRKSAYKRIKKGKNQRKGKGREGKELLEPYVINDEEWWKRKRKRKRKRQRQR
jgi:hypothetical protein